MEFALVIPLVLTLVLGVVELAVVARSEIQLVHAAREGARQSAASPDTSAAVAAVRRALGGDGSKARVAVSRPTTIGDPTTVRVTLPYNVLSPFIGGYPIELHAAATMRVER
ncbi:MAG: TadE family type IV pilus minor pilin [Acidimicrobiia bacterium]